MVQTKNDSLKHKIYTIVFEAETKAGRTFDIILLFLILLSVLIISIETVPEIVLNYRQYFKTIEWVFTFLFTLEYILRIYSSPRPFRYIFSFFGIVDFLAILPTYLSLFLVGSQYLLVIRILRLLRAARIFKLTQFVNEGQVLTRALRASMAKISVFVGVVLMVVVIVGSIMYIVEGVEHGFTSIPKSIYWAIVTLTTVGYGDIAPGTTFGQILASLLMIMGYGIIAVPTGIVSVELANIDKNTFNSRVCPQCHKEGHAREAKYCSNCGNQLTNLT
ncbi:ion transporter [Adhaeribacter radiodurans]|uniref:Ion transporter n=1 Tax=Adhaeribacter radiodurans TaxID=2745197 RepID=A0A7L7L8R1_9BACT|nr:ion transporter [Adhaeribacter radiodurans]QMU29222.1 ion transporter [Adhaeribacter radiodurans]